MRTISDGSGLVARLKNLPEVIRRKDHDVFLSCGVLRGVADIDQVIPEWQMGTMFLNNADRQQTSSLRLLNRLDEIRSGELFPLDGKRCLGMRTTCNKKCKYSNKDATIASRR